MSSRPSTKDIRLLCDAVGPDDGLDPRYTRRAGRRPPGRKVLQLCQQVREALDAALAACGDAALRELAVAAVTPAGGGRLLVTLRPGGLEGAPPAAELQASLVRAHGLLRREAAAAVHRRKAPELVFQLLLA